MINSFREENFFLSNMFPVKIKHEDIIYPSVEHFYVSQKFDKDLTEIINEEKFNIRKEDFLIGTLAELHPIKGLEFLIKASKILKDNIPDKYKNVKILILGEGQEKNRLGKIITDLSLQNNVILGGFLENGSKYLKGFEVFILPSLSEAMPLSLLEAGQACLPVIATNVGGIPEIIEDKKTGLLIEPGNENNIVEAIDSIINNEVFANELAINLKNKINTEFDVEIFYKKTFDLYK